MRCDEIIHVPFLLHTLRVNLIKADKLLKKDIGVLGMGKSDPYATLEVGSRSDKTKIIKNTIIFVNSNIMCRIFHITFRE